MTPLRRSLLGLALALAVPCFAGCASTVRAQADLDRAPWATSMVYPVGDPLDFRRPAPGETRGFQLSRGLQGKPGHRRHEGLDLSNRGSGGQVRAVAPGVVVVTRTGHKGWGNMVVLAHRLPGGEVLFSLAAHLLPGSIAVREGQVVALGQPVGKIGSTGRSTGPHLHLEFRSLKGAFDALAEPLTRAWETAAIVDPMRVLTSMLPSGETSPGRAPLASLDALTRLVSRGGLPKQALNDPAAPLTRGELYRMALAALDGSERVIPSRWSAQRARLLAAAAKLPEEPRAKFSADTLPRREKDARRAADLGETVQVFQALARAGALGTKGSGAVDGTVARREIEQHFPQGLLATEASAAAGEDRSASASAPAPASPAVTRAQACLLWSYLETAGAR